MSADEDDFTPREDEDADFVAAVVARSHSEAQRYRDLLEDHGIPAIIEDERSQEEGPGLPTLLRQGIPVLVPEALLDEASEIIADRENLSEFKLVDEDEDDE